MIILHVVPWKNHIREPTGNLIYVISLACSYIGKLVCGMDYILYHLIYWVTLSVAVALERSDVLMSYPKNTCWLKCASRF